MSDLTVEQLRGYLAEAAGAPPQAAGEGFAELEFASLGYDSLALMEVSARLNSEYGVVIPDDDLFALRTPGQMIDLINAALRRIG